MSDNKPVYHLCCCLQRMEVPYRSGGVWEEEYLGLSPSLLHILSCCLPCLLLLPSPLATFRRAKGHKGQSRTARNWGVLNNARVFLALLTLLLGVIFRLLLALSSNFCHTDIVLLGVSFFTFLLGIGKFPQHHPLQKSHLCHPDLPLEYYLPL